MNTRIIELTHGRKVELAESGRGTPLLYLHGFADVHGASVGWLPMHEQLARSYRLIAPAHPGCAGSHESEAIDTIDDVEFHLLELLDALGLTKVDVVGHCFGGWLAAELAVRNPERVNRLVLIGASGLFVPGEPIGDLFWEVQAQNGVEYRGLRELLFADAAAPAAHDMLPDGRSDAAREISRYKVMRYASRVGFKPPYFYNRNLIDRLHRFEGKSLLLWGGEDRMVPLAHARAYEQGLKGARLHIIAGGGHAVIVEQPAAVAAAIRTFLTPPTINAHPRTGAKTLTRKPVKKTVSARGGRAARGKAKPSVHEPAAGRRRAAKRPAKKRSR